MILLNGLLSATLSKFLLCLRAVGLDGKWPGLGRSVVRNFLRTVDSLPTLNILGVILILQSELRDHFVDRVARTCVIDMRSL